MCNEIASDISSEVIGLFKKFDDEYLADVLRIWDYDAGDWCNIFAVVYRFENNDLLVWKDPDMFRARIGAVDTTLMGRLNQQAFERMLSSEECLSWRLDNSYEEQIGRKGVVSELLTRLTQIHAKSE